MSLELRHWRAFAAAAETQHFGLAAERLNITQPALSQLIRTLEKTLGVKLFDRAHRRVALTEAGQMLLPEAHTVLAQSVRAERVGQVAGRSEQRTLAAGYVGSAALHPIFTRFAGALAAVRPAITLRLDQQPADSQIEGVAGRQLDLGIVRSPMPAVGPGLTVITLAQESLVLALGAGHPAAGGDGACNLAAFANDAFLLYRRQPSGGLRLLCEDACETAGFEPRVAQTVPQIATMLCLVGAGLGVALVPQSAARLGVPGVVYRDLSEPIVTDLNLVHRRSDTGPALREAVRIAQNIDKFSL